MGRTSEHTGRRRVSIRALLAVGVFMLTALVALGQGLGLAIVRDGAGPIFMGQCAGSASVVLGLSVYEHPLDFEFSDSIGYGLSYREPPATNVTLYNNALLTQDAHGVMPSWYAGWRYKNGAYQPVRSVEFAPLPAPRPGLDVRVFERPDRVYDRNRRVPEADNPPFMDIFVDPAQVPSDLFNRIADCLGQHRADINAALASIPARLPGRDAQYYHALRLGGIVHGFPPYSDDAYLNQIRQVWGDTAARIAIPEYGPFTLYPGQSASGVINEQAVSLALSEAGSLRVLANGKTADPALSTMGDGWLIAGGVCSTDMDHCGKWIAPWGDPVGRSMSFAVRPRVSPSAFADDPPVAKH